MLNVTQLLFVFRVYPSADVAVQYIAERMSKEDVVRQATALVADLAVEAADKPFGIGNLAFRERISDLGQQLRRREEVSVAKSFS